LTSSIHDNERDFQELCHRLGNGIGQRGRLDLYHQYLSRLTLGRNQSMVLSYYLEIQEDFLDLITDENLKYRTPAFIEDIQHICSHMQATGVVDSNDLRFQSGMENLEYRCMAALIYAGDIQQALRCLKLDPNLLEPPGSTGDRYQRFLAAKEAVATRMQAPQPQLERLDQEWIRQTRGASDDMVWIPLVEKCEGIGGSELVSATIQPLRVQVERRRDDARQDLIFFNNHPIADNDLIYYQALDAVNVARRRLRSGRRPQSQHFRVMFGFPHSEYFYTGESFGLGMSLAVLAQMEKVTIQRAKHRIISQAVITGGLDLNGQVRPIADQSLPEKIAAFHHSPFASFVHPHANEAIAEQSFSRYPGHAGLYERVAVETFSDLVKQRGVVEHKTISMGEWSRAHLRKSHILQYFLVLLFLGLTAWGLWTLNQDVNPVQIEMDKNMMMSFNRHDDLLWSQEVIPVEAMRASDLNRQKKMAIHLIADLNGDGVNEIVYSVPTVSPEYAGHITCMDHSGQILWDSDVGGEASFGGTLYERPFSIGELLIHNEDSSSPSLVAMFNHHPWFPAKLVHVSATGEILGVYHHGGSLSDIELLDVNDDGVKDLIFCGTNNESRDAIMGALDLADISGHSPQQADQYLHSGSAEASHLFYLRFPKGDWLDLGEKSRNFAIRELRMAGNDNLMVTVANLRLMYFAIYQFGPQMAYLGASFSDNMLDHYLTLHGHPLYEDFSRDFVGEKLDAILAWDGSEWVGFTKPWMGDD